MPKIADVYFKPGDFTVAEEGFDPAHSLVAESVFALANEYMGVRGYIEEGMGEKSLRGTYLNGVYELDGEEGPGGYKGIVKQTHYMVTCADLFKTDMDLQSPKAEHFSRTLDMEKGLLRRETVYGCKNGRVNILFERLVSMAHNHLAAQRMTLTADAPMEIKLTLGIDGTIKHQNTGRCQWQAVEKRQGAMTLKTTTTGQRVSYGYKLSMDGEEAFKEQTHRMGTVLSLSLKPGETVVIDKVIAVLRDATAAQALRAAQEAPAFETLKAENTDHYAHFWQENDVEIGGDPMNRQGIRFCLFQLHQTYRGAIPGSNIGAKGLTGEAYNGHAFWDTETYCLAPYLLTDPKAAKNLLMYRYQTLPQAIKRAEQLDLKGACYPIATLNGNEACNLWQHASLQMQPSTSVAYAIEYYYHLTGDTAFLHNEGAQMLVEIARYCISRGNWNQDKTGFGYYGVMGPDEFHMMVNNNFYTNFMGKKALEAAVKVLESAPEVKKRLAVSHEELENFKCCAEHMILEKREDNVFPQHEGYFSLPHLDIHSIPQNEFPLYHHWSYDRIYRTDMIKQPDILMAIFLHPSDFTLEEIRANYDYYESRCIHESSLSPSIHSVVASWLGLSQDAYRFFGFATRLDLDNYNNNTTEGLHTTSLAAAWVSIVYGFLGLKTDRGHIEMAPKLPESWTSLKLKLTLFGRRVEVYVTSENVRLTLLEGDKLTVVLYGQQMEVGA